MTSVYAFPNILSYEYLSRSVYITLISFAAMDINSSDLSSSLFYLVLFNLIVIIIGGELGILGTVPVQRVFHG